MRTEFRDKDLKRMRDEAGFTGGFSDGIVGSFREVIQYIENAPDERAFAAMRSLRFEKLKGDRDGQYSMRLNNQWRLILEFEGKRNDKKVRVVEIVDYH
jgi:proteic killer suppression protein